MGESGVVGAAAVEDGVPAFLRDKGQGWVTAEYAMLPRSSHGRIPRDSVTKGRAQEISRLIGRSLRCIMDLSALGERQIMLDCDVLQADGGTRTAAITGAFVALHDAVEVLLRQEKLKQSPILSPCAAISIGVVEGEPLLDLCYQEDSAADVDLNLVMSGTGDYIEIQGCAEGEAFPRTILDRLLELGEKGIRQLLQAQAEALGRE